MYILAQMIRSCNPPVILTLTFSPWVRYQLKVHPEGCKIGPFGCIVYLYQFASQGGAFTDHHVLTGPGREPEHFRKLHVGTEKAFCRRQGHSALQTVPRLRPRRGWESGGQP